MAQHPSAVVPVASRPQDPDVSYSAITVPNVPPPPEIAWFKSRPYYSKGKKQWVFIRPAHKGGVWYRYVDEPELAVRQPGEIRQVAMVSSKKCRVSSW